MDYMNPSLFTDMSSNIYYHFIKLTSSTYTVWLDLNKESTIAKPTAASAAATAITKNTNICPEASPK